MATDNNGFQIVGPKQISAPVLSEQTKRRLPSVSFAILGMIVLGCLLANVIATKDPSYMDLMNYTKAPNREFLFGTDNLGRDIFSCIWYGGRISLSVGVIATVISTVLAILYGSVSGLASDMVDTIMMRGAEIVLTIPSILLCYFYPGCFRGADHFVDCLCHRYYKLVQYCKGCPHRGTAAPQKRIHCCLKVYGRIIFPYSHPASRTEFYLCDHVYGCDEYAFGHCYGVHIKLYGHGTAAGSDFLGKPVVIV